MHIYMWDQPWVFFGRNDAKAETPVLWLPHAKGWLIGKDSDARGDWGQEEKGTTEDEKAGWHHWLDGREFEWTLGDGDGQGGVACCDSWGRKESDTTERLNWTEHMKVWKWFSYEFRGNSSMASSLHSLFLPGPSVVTGSNLCFWVLLSKKYIRAHHIHSQSQCIGRDNYHGPYMGTSALGRFKCWANSHCNSITRGPGALEITFLLLYFLPISQVLCFRAQKQDPVLQPWTPSRANLQKIISLKQISLWLQKLIYNSVTAYEAA